MPNRIRTTLGRIALGLAVLASALSAQAATVKIDGFSNGSASVYLTPPAVVNPTSAGRYTGKLDGQSFLSFCIDLFQTIHFGQTYTSYASVAADTYAGFASGVPGAVRAANLGRLASGYLDLISAGATSTERTIRSAAFQLAVWELARETTTTTPYSLSTGGFTAAPNLSDANADDAIALANTWLGSLPVASTYAANIVLFSASQQDLVTFSPVPLPGGLLLLGSGLVAFGFLRRRR